jgi:splicing factor 3A subunit 2
VDYPDCGPDVQPRHRFMSAYEQKVEAPDRNYQFLLFACEPYETVAFKIPNQVIDKGEGKFYTNWDRDQKKFVVQLYFVDVVEDVAVHPPMDIGMDEVPAPPPMMME